MTPLYHLRRWLLALFVCSALGLAAELLLTAHWEDVWQLVPLVALGLSLVTLGAAAAWRHAAPLRAFQATMVACVLSGGVGIWLHYRAKTEFALERDPSLSGMALLKEAIQGTSPPILAPGAMAALGLLGLAWTYRHPSLTPNGVPS